MIKRLTWFTTGVMAGAAGTVYAGKKLKRKAEQLKPVNMAKAAAEKVKDRAHDLVEALREGRQAMLDKEEELKALRDGGLDTTEVVPVQPGQVIVLQPARHERARRRDMPPA